MAVALLLFKSTYKLAQEKFQTLLPSRRAEDSQLLSREVSAATIAGVNAAYVFLFLVLSQQIVLHIFSDSLTVYNYVISAAVPAVAIYSYAQRYI